MKKIPLLISCLLLAGPAAADLTLRSKSSSSGLRGMGAYESTTERKLSGMKSREESNFKFTGAILGKLSGKKGKDAADILRVDLDKRWRLDLKNKSYAEFPISLPPADEKPEAAAQAPAEAGKPAPESQPTHRIKSAKVEVEKLGKEEKINGFPCAGYRGTARVVVEEIKTKQTAEFRLVSDIWATPWTDDLRKAVKEEGAFAKAYLAKLSERLGQSDQKRFDFDSAKQLLGAAGPEVQDAVAKLKTELDKIEGYPIVTESSWHAPQAPGADKAKAGEEEDEGSALDDMDGANSAGGAVAGLLGGLAKRAVKKKAKEKLAPKAGAPASSVRTEVLEVKVAPLPAETFEIPSGFKKKD